MLRDFRMAMASGVRRIGLLSSLDFGERLALERVTMVLESSVLRVEMYCRIDSGVGRGESWDSMGIVGSPFWKGEGARRRPGLGWVVRRGR